MKYCAYDQKKFIPASHEDPNNPGVLKKVLLQRAELFPGHIQMINWASLLPNKSFASHFHQDMQEVFVMIDGSAVAEVDGKSVPLERGDVLVIDAGEKHCMRNTTNVEVTYLAIGIAPESGGTTIAT